VIVTRHMGSLAAIFAAESLGVPLVSVFTAVAQATCWPLFRQLCEVHLRDDLNRSRRLIGLDDVTSWPTWFALPSLYLGCWPEWFAQRAPTWPADVRSLGFLRSDEAESEPLPDDLERWLDRGPRPILVTGGTARWALLEQFYRTAVAACRIAGHRVVVACPDAVSIGNVDDGVVRYRHLPFGTLASRVSAVIHHGGTSVLVRAMVSDLPQLTMPYGADRPDTADRLVKTGVAMTVPPSCWQPEHVAERLTQLLASERVRSACTRMGRLARAPAPGLVPACEAIERLAA
jgi:UDP:flavonoid glycosyltransferase YjiC (YdhE family)